MSLESLCSGYSGQLQRPSTGQDTSGSPTRDPFANVGTPFSCTIQVASGHTQMMWQSQRGIHMTHQIYTTTDFGQIPAGWRVLVGTRVFLVHNYAPDPDVMASRRFFVFDAEEQAQRKAWSGAS